MSDYSQAKIYKLVSKSSDDIYIGSTCNPLKQRLSGHIWDYKMFLIGKQHFITSYHLANYENVQIVLVENFTCQTNAELCKREGYFIRNTMCVNKVVPGRTRQEYRDDNKAELIAKVKKYYTQNKAKIDARRNAKFVCDCGGKYTRVNRAIHERTAKHQSFSCNHS